MIVTIWVSLSRVNIQRKNAHDTHASIDLKVHVARSELKLKNGGHFESYL
jgi:hypothetical protein